MYYALPDYAHRDAMSPHQLTRLTVDDHQSSLISTSVLITFGRKVVTTVREEESCSPAVHPRGAAANLIILEYLWLSDGEVFFWCKVELAEETNRP